MAFEQPVTPGLSPSPAALANGVLTPEAELALVRGATYPSESATPDAKVAYLDGLWGEGEADALVRYKQGTQCVLYEAGEQHIGWRSRRREWEALPLADGEERVTMNYIAPIVRARIERLTSPAVNFRIVPESNSYEAVDQAKVGVDFLEARWERLRMKAKIRDGAKQATMTAFVALKSFWNPTLGPLTPATLMVPAVDPATGAPLADELGQPQFREVFADANGQPTEGPEAAFKYRPGDTDTSLRTIFNLRVNPEAAGWTAADGLRWVLDKDVVPLSVARERFRHVAAEIRPLQNAESSLTYERLVRSAAALQEKGGFTVTPHVAGRGKMPDPAQLTAILEYWEMPSVFYPNGRLVVTVGGTVAYDGPWPQGILPYAPIYGLPAVMSPWGRSAVADMIPPQDVINTEWTTIKKEMRAAGTGQFVAWGVPGMPQQIPREDNAIVAIPVRSVLSNRPISDVFQRMPQAQVSPDRWHMIQESKTTAFDVGAFHEVSRGQIPPGLDSGVAIQYLLEQEVAQLADTSDALREAIILWGRHQLAIARWGYGDAPERWIPIHRPDLGYRVRSIRGMNLPDPETVQLDIEHFRPKSEAAVRAQLMEMLAIPGLLDPRKALKIMDLGAGVDQMFDSETRHYARARSENLDFESGNYIELPVEKIDPITGALVPTLACFHPPLAPEDPPFPFLLPDDDDHLLHIEVHSEVALDETRPPLLRMKVLQHIAEHRAIVRAALIQQMSAPVEDDGEGGPNDKSSDQSSKAKSKDSPSK